MKQLMYGSLHSVDEGVAAGADRDVTGVHAPRLIDDVDDVRHDERTFHVGISAGCPGAT